MFEIERLQAEDLVSAVRGYVSNLMGILFRVAINRNISPNQVREVELLCQQIHKHFRRTLDAARAERNDDRSSEGVRSKTE